ncbi:hydantoinase B/oxoprolinase family protein [Mucisphaera sp.]|uniref:hydantoinase B/oxoprolinase family protein n=1 Tax=Mucisphaera sp. TaxID=2913024 RepID=UPI003D0FAB99
MTQAFTPIDIELYKHLLTAIAEEMGIRLMRSAYSPNIKERRDHSCALFDASGRLMAQAAHIPVHLGSAAVSVAAVMEAFDPASMVDGQMFILNDPYAGGTHLPDVTAVAPVILEEGQRPAFYVANRAHHADVGGSRPGSLSLIATIEEEGVRFGPMPFDKAFIEWFANQTRTPGERCGDLFAQAAALRLGVQRMKDLCTKRGSSRMSEAGDALIAYSQRMMQAVIRDLPDGCYRFEDALDNDPLKDPNRPVWIRVALEIEGDHARIDFSESDDQMQGPLNAVRAITLAATQYCFRCLGPADLPDNAGVLNALEVITRPGSVVEARYPAAVAAGNVETSQRIVDVLFGALAQAAPDRVPAASAGSMTNLTLGGMDPRHADQKPFAYYETIAGGAGAGPASPGASCIQIHMTNTLNTPTEALEHAYPLRVRSVSVRPDSGGTGLHRGGDGMVRVYEALVPTEVTLIAERHQRPPYGLCGGEPGACGRASLIHLDGRRETLSGKVERTLNPGEQLVIETPGGGGWGQTDPPADAR